MKKEDARAEVILSQLHIFVLDVSRMASLIRQKEPSSNYFFGDCKFSTCTNNSALIKNRRILNHTHLSHHNKVRALRKEVALQMVSNLHQIILFQLLFTSDFITTNMLSKLFLDQRRLICIAH